MTAFLSSLDQRGIDYVLVGGSLPHPTPIEVLVEDDSLSSFDDLLTNWPVGRPVKIYTVAARPGTGYRPTRVNGYHISRISLFPPYIARGILQRAVRTSDGTKVLSSTDAFLARCYRAAYLHLEDWQKDGSDNYRLRPSVAEKLAVLASAAEMSLPEGRAPSDLDKMLNEHGWRPPGDFLDKASYWLPWISAQILEKPEPSPPGLVAFFIRERAFWAGHKKSIIHYLKDKGFDTLLVMDLDPGQRAVAQHSLRGGNWGIGGWGVSGGGPACLLITHDLLPLPLKPFEQHRHPGFDNRKIFKTKLCIRNEINRRLPASEQYSPVHSTDNSQQTWAVIRLLAPEREASLREEIAKRENSFASPGALLDFTRHGGRARIELVDHNGIKAVRKTCRPGAERYMQREIDVMRELAPFCPEIPKLIDAGENYFLTEFLEGADQWSPPPWPHALPLSKVRALADFIKRCVAHGWDPVDLKPSNNVMFTASGLKVIDFEYWRRCDPSTNPEDCYCLAGLPQEYTGDRPIGLPFLFDPYPAEWRRYTVLNIREFLYDPIWLQFFKRSIRLALRHSNILIRRALRKILRRAMRLMSLYLTVRPKY